MDRNALLAEQLSTPMLERFIGVIYQPETERQSHYAQAAVSKQFDAYVWFDQTEAVTPVSLLQSHGEDDTYPTGL
jgi:erythromycin esterase-like protein